MGESETNKPGGGIGLGALEAGQVVEIRVRGDAASYWSYIRTVAGGVTVWLPELKREFLTLADGATVDLSVTLNNSEILVTEGTVKSSGEEGKKPYAALELNPNTVSMAHQRRYLRVAAVVPVTIKRLPDGMNPWGDPVKARTTSLSPGGLSLEAEAAFTKGELLSVELELPGGKAEATAEVVEASAATVKPITLSVKFTHISDNSEAAITKLIYQYQRLHGASRL